MECHGVQLVLILRTMRAAVEEWDDEFQKIEVSQCPLSPNSADYESNSYEECDDEFQKNGVSLCPLSPNSKDYESGSDEGQDDALSPNSNEYIKVAVTKDRM